MVKYHSQQYVFLIVIDNCQFPLERVKNFSHKFFFNQAQTTRFDALSTQGEYYKIVSFLHQVYQGTYHGFIKINQFIQFLIFNVRTTRNFLPDGESIPQVIDNHKLIEYSYTLINTIKTHCQLKIQLYSMFKQFNKNHVFKIRENNQIYLQIEIKQILMYHLNSALF
ncbi:hypothetical protein pb186bvf_015284 [Paramecium bursaria]